MKNHLNPIKSEEPVAKNIPLAEDKHAAVTNADDGARLKREKNWRGEGPQGPNYNRQSKEEDGATSNNAGTFK